MILPALILILMVAGLLAWFTGKRNAMLPRIISLAAILTDAVLLMITLSQGQPGGQNTWLIDYKAGWIPQFGISLHLAMDGLSLLLVALTLFIGLISVIISWKEISERTGFFHFNLLWILAGIIGVFLSLDLFLFYFFWELMLVPMYFLISDLGA